MKETKLSKRQNEILVFIKKYIAKNGYSPSVREIANGVGLSSPATVHIHLQNLISLGFLKREGNGHKVLELMVPNEFEVRDGEAIEVPFYDVYVTRDFKREFRKTARSFSLTSQMIPSGSEVFMIMMEDNSMMGQGILKGDYLLVDKTNIISHRDVVVLFSSDGDILVRSYYEKNGHITFQASHEKYSSYEDSQPTILGKVIGLYREF